MQEKAGDMGLIPGLERSLEEEMVTRSSILAWEIPWIKEPGGLQSMRLQESDTTLLEGMDGLGPEAHL